MAPGPRNYGVGTERALFRLAKGTCYFPECMVPVISQTGGHYIVGVEIAHIHGALPNSARFVPSQSDDERRAFSNLVLLCISHHKLVDKIDPAAFPADVLQEWKRANEHEDAGEITSRGINDDELELLLQRVYAAAAPTREITLSVTGGVVINEREVIGWEIAATDLLMAEHPQLWQQPRVVVAEVSNTGLLPVSVAQIDFSLMVTDGETTHELALVGRNDFGASNPPLPYRLLDGDAVTWFTLLDTFEMIAMGLETTTGGKITISSVQARARLGTGESFKSSHTPWKLHDATEPSAVSHEDLGD